MAALALAFTLFDVPEPCAPPSDAIGRLGRWGPALFVLIYILATVLFLPGSVLALGAGARFGVVWDSIYASVASTLGATAAFLVGRYFARDWVAKKSRARAPLPRLIGPWRMQGGSSPDLPGSRRSFRSRYSTKRSVSRR